MKNKILTFDIKARLGRVDWKLLAFLLLFLNFKLVIKIAAIMLIYILRPDFKFGFRIKKSRLPLFYLFVIGIALFNWLLTGMHSSYNYALVLMTGVLFWVLCILAIHQVKYAIENNDPGVIHQTMLLFFIINIIVSLSVYAGIVWETGAINPYRYQGNYQKYFIGTGDYIKGLTFDTSTTNAVISALGVIYFLLRKKNIMAILCMAVLLLTGSNFTNLLLCCTLLYIFLLQSNKDQKSIIVTCFMMMIIFWVKVSPQNNKYVTTAYQKLFNIKTHDTKDQKIDIPITERPDSTLTIAERKQKFARLYLDSINIALSKKNTRKPVPGTSVTAGITGRPIIPGDSIHTPSFQHRNDTSQAQKKLVQFIRGNTGQLRISSRLVNQSKLPGKLVALQQSFHFLLQHPAGSFTGIGIGNFSSKLAFRATSMNLTGGYPARFAYISDDFKSNHLDLFLFYFTDKDDYHSVINSPNSTYDQLLTEYGIAGLVSFVVFYIGFFTRGIEKRSPAIPLLLFMLGAFFIEYWFEQLSVVIFFELIVLLHVKETNLNKNNASA